MAKKYKSKTEAQSGENLSAQLEEISRASTSAKQLLAEINRITDALSKVDDKSGLLELGRQLQSIGTEADKAGEKGTSFIGAISSGMNRLTDWTAEISKFFISVQFIKDMSANVINLDSAMIDLKRTTDLTDSAYERLLDSSISKAKKLGTGITDIVEATAAWSKLGYSDIVDANRYAEISTIYQKVGDLDSLEAGVKDIDSAMRAFDTEDAEHIIDVYNELGNISGVSSGDIGQGMQKAAAALALTGNSMEQAAAILAGGGQISGDIIELAEAAQVGALRLASMKDTLQEMGEEYEDIDSVSSIQAKIYDLTSGQVDIYDKQNGQLKDTYTIWRDIADVFGEMDASRQKSVLELLFGKNRADQGAAILEGFQGGQIDKALSDALSSDGSAIKEYGKYTQGIQYSLDRLNASFEELSSTVIDSGLLKFFIDLGNIGVNSINGIIDALTPLGTLLTVGSGILGAKGLGLT